MADQAQRTGDLDRAAVLLEKHLKAAALEAELAQGKAAAESVADFVKVLDAEEGLARLDDGGAPDGQEDGDGTGDAEGGTV
jgi:type II secretory pathway component PulJ